MEFNPLPNLKNTRFTITEIGLFYGGEHLEADMQIPNFFWQDHFKMAIFGLY